MNSRITLALAMLAGLAGGILSRNLSPTPVYAKTSTVPQEFRAQKFVLVDEGGRPRGAFGIETNGWGFRGKMNAIPG